MVGLGRRLVALERIAAEGRRREVRELLAGLPEAHGLTPAELGEATDIALGCLGRLDALRRRGMSEREALLAEAERIAAEHGMTADRVLREAGIS